MQTIGPTPMKFTQTNHGPDFRRKKKTGSRWLFRLALLVVVLAGLAIWLVPQRQAPGSSATTDAPAQSTAEPAVVPAD